MGAETAAGVLLGAEGMDMKRRRGEDLQSACLLPGPECILPASESYINKILQWPHIAM